MWEKLAIWEKLATIAHALGLLFYLVVFYLPMAKNELGVIFFIAVALGQFWLWCWLLKKSLFAGAHIIVDGFKVKWALIFIACWLGLIIMLGCLLMGGGIILLWIITIVLYLLFPSFR